MRTLGLLSLLALFAAGCIPSRTATPPAVAATPAKPKPKPGDLKPYAEVIADAETDEGLVTLHVQERGLKLLGEVPDSLLGREMLIVSRVSRAAEGSGYGGQKTNTQVVRFDRVGQDLLLRTIRYSTVAADSLPVYTAVRNSSFEPVVARLEALAVREDTSTVVDMTDLFTTDVPTFGIPKRMRDRYKVRRLDKDRSYLARAAAYPTNVEVRSVLTYDAQEPPTNASTGTLSVEMAHSMIALPEEPMRPRRLDPRVGFFSVGQVDYGLPTQRAETRRYVTRWRLVPSDLDAYARGELVEPVEPITFYVDPATPDVWRPYLKQGVEDWNVAFEAAGFKNAIRALDPPSPEEDPDWSPEDARYSVIRYFASPIQNAYGPHVHDPRSGEILESDIGWYHNVMNLLRNWFFVQTAAVNPEARSTKFKDEVMGELVRFVSAHEVGHTLGFPHNFISSNAYPVDSLRSPTFTAQHGTAPSIMDYARFNYIAQPEDGVTQLMPRVGEYDKWVTNWGYRYFPDAESEEEERARLQAMAAEALSDPALRYGAQQGDPLDPRSQSEDLGDDAVYASRLGLANLKRIVPNLTEWAVDDGETYESLAEVYGNVVAQWGRYLGHVSRTVGGVYTDRRVAGDEGVLYVPVDAETQRRAVRFLVEEGLSRPDWLLDADLLARVEPAGSGARVLGLQEGTLARLLDLRRLGRMEEHKAMDLGAYGPDELLADLRTALWGTRGAAPADPTRRALQRAHVDRLAELMTTERSPATVSPMGTRYATLPASRSDVRPLARGELVALRARAATGARRATDRVTRLHYAELVARIDDALDPDG